MMRRAVLLPLAGAAALAILPLIVSMPADEPFAGADGQAESAIQNIRPDYQPWASPLWEPPSGEIEGLLFALQAALGAGFLGYYVGLRRGQAQAGRTGGAAANDAQA